ncbi:MAG: glycosyltransferase [Planctomycetes bacterium]|nr:glycosyltransferase [Planctomycetota bacterium]
MLGGGGVANAVIGLANAQAELGAEVLITGKEAPGYHLPPLVHPSIRTHFWRQRASTFLGRIVRPGPRPAEFDALRQFKPDVVHVHGEFNPDNLCVAARIDCPLVVSPHGCFHPGVFDKRRSSQKRLYFRLARRLLYRHATMHASSPLEATHISALLPNQNVYCATLGPGVQSPAAVGAARELRSPGPKLVFVGRLDIYTKGLDILLEAFAIARRGQQARSATLHLVGSDQCGSRRRLELLVKSLELSDHVTFHGQASPAEVARFLADADVYVQLSRHEGFGLSVVEALFAGLPAVLSDGIGVVSYPEVSGLPHVLVVKPEIEAAAQAIARAIADRALLREQALTHVNALRDFFSWESTAAQQLVQYGTIARPSISDDPSAPAVDATPGRGSPVGSAGR